MSKPSVKTALLSILLLSVAGFSGVSSAHTTGLQSLGAALGAKDIYRVVCFSYGNGIHPNSMPPEVNGAANKFIASLQFGSNPALRIQALPNGASVSPGGLSTSFIGNGIHYFSVSHTLAVAHSYTANYDCTNAANSITGIGEGFIGNPPNVISSLDYVKTQNQ